MKYIKKAGAPHEYRSWRKRVAGTQDDHFQVGLRNPLKRTLHTSLLAEQGYLCAYTMKYIDLATSHIEHIKPETLCRAEKPGSDLDYENIVACFPREGMPRKYRYGAQERDDWWENDGAEFVKPLDVNCEKRFQFDLEGNIKATGNNTAALTTIEKLGLAHDTLVEDRRRVIYEYVYGQNGDAPLSAPQATQATLTICSLDKQHRYCEFCVAIRDALQQHIGNLKKRAKKSKFIRRR